MSSEAALHLVLGLCLAGGAAVLLGGPVHRVRSVARSGAGAVPAVPWWARFTRDATGRVVAATDALGHTTHYTWDDRGRLWVACTPVKRCSRSSISRIAAPASRGTP